MATNKTQPTDQDVTQFLEMVSDSTRREDSHELRKILTQITGEPARMWGPTMVGFGEQIYRYASGRSGNWFLIGFAPRKASLSLYLADGIDNHAAQLAKLGKHRRGVGCLYINKLEDVDQELLREMLETSVAAARGHGKQT
jgi:hypothetical protein